MDPSAADATPLTAEKCLQKQAIRKSGRQDLNLRPPGPQPELCGGAQAYAPCLQGFVAGPCP
jgi:hypothetical protein